RTREEDTSIMAQSKKREDTQAAHTKEQFEFAGKKFLAKGTSGSPLTVGGRPMQTEGTSGPHPSAVQIAPGRPIRHGSVTGISSASGTHAPIGRPTRIS